MEEKKNIQLPENAHRELKPGEEYHPLMDPDKKYAEATPYSVGPEYAVTVETKLNLVGCFVPILLRILSFVHESRYKIEEMSSAMCVGGQCRLGHRLNLVSPASHLHVELCSSQEMWCFVFHGAKIKKSHPIEVGQKRG